MAPHSSIVVLIVLIGAPCLAELPPWDAGTPADILEKTRRAGDLRLRGDLATSQQILEDVVRTNPQSFSARYQLGLTYQRLRELDRAIEELSIAARMNDERRFEEWTIDNALGYALLERGNHWEALKRLRMATRANYLQKLDPVDRQRIFNNIGLANSHVGNACEAKLYYDLADVTSSANNQISPNDILLGFWIVARWNERGDGGSVLARARPVQVSGTLAVKSVQPTTRYEGYLKLCASDRPRAPARLIEQRMAIDSDGRSVKMRGRIVSGHRWEPDTISGTLLGNEINGRVTDGQPGRVEITLTKAL